MLRPHPDPERKKGPMIEITRETKNDWWEVEALYDLCFAPGRTALSSYRLRDGVDPLSELCFVARDADGILGGVIRNWPVYVGGRLAILLGPVAVHPTRQGEGVGAMLMRKALNRAHDLGWARVMLVGDYPYYKRFGFFKLEGVEMPPPTNPDRILGYNLTPGAWIGVSGEVTSAKDCKTWTRPQSIGHEQS